MAVRSAALGDEFENSRFGLDADWTDSETPETRNSRSGLAVRTGRTPGLPTPQGHGRMVTKNASPAFSPVTWWTILLSLEIVSLDRV